MIIAGDGNETWNGFAAVIKQLSSIRHLHLSICPVYIIYRIAAHMPQLETLIIESILCNEESARKYAYIIEINIFLCIVLCN